MLQPFQRGKTDRINQPVLRGSEPRASRLGGVVWGGPQFSGWAVWDRPRVKRRGFGWADVTAYRRGWGVRGRDEGRDQALRGWWASGSRAEPNCSGPGPAARRRRIVQVPERAWFARARPLFVGPRANVRNYCACLATCYGKNSPKFPTLYRSSQLLSFIFAPCLETDAEPLEF